MHNRLELISFDPIILRGNETVILQSLRNQVLDLAHEEHPGKRVLKRRLRARILVATNCLLVSQPYKQPPMRRHKFPDGFAVAQQRNDTGNNSLLLQIPRGKVCKSNHIDCYHR